MNVFQLLIQKSVLLAVLFVPLFYGCGESEPVKIGYVAGVTGRHSELGIGIRNGIHLAVSDLNESGGINGRKINLVVRDDGGSPEQAARVINELMDDNVQIIIGPLLSKMARATIEVITGRDVLVFSPTISTNALSKIDDNFLRLIPESSFQAESIAAAIHVSPHRQLGVVYDSSNAAYTKPIYELFKRRMDESGRNITYVNDLSGGQEKDLSAVADEIVEKNVDALFFVTSSIDAGELSQQIRKKDQDVQFYGTYWVKSGKIIEIGGRSVEGMILSTIFESPVKDQVYIDFEEKYKKQFIVEPNWPSVYGYESMMIIAEGAGEAGSFEPGEVKEAIIRIGEFEGLEEKIKIDEFGDAVRSRGLVQISDGTFVRLDI